VMLVACAGAATPVSIPPLGLPKMETEHRVVSAERLAHDATDPPAMTAALDDAGFASATERTYAGPGDRFSLAITRVLSFEDADGAQTYLSWLEDHASTLVGAVEVRPPLDLPGSPFVVVHLPGGCCPKAVPIYASAWRRGVHVLYLQASGRRADPSAFEALARDFDHAVSGATGA